MFHINRTTLAFCVWLLSLFKCFQGSSMFWHVLHSLYGWVILSSIWDGMIRIPYHTILYRYGPFGLSTHQWMNIWVVFTFCMLWIMLLWTFVYKFLLEHFFSIPLSIDLQVESLGPYDRSIFNFLRDYYTFIQMLYHSTFPSAMQEVIDFSISSQTLVIFCFTTANFVDVKWYLIIVLICISLMTKDVEHVCKSLMTICISSLEIYK